MFFWNSLAFLMIQQMLAIWSLVPLPFLKPVWTTGSSQFMYSHIYCTHIYCQVVCTHIYCQVLVYHIFCLWVMPHFLFFYVFFYFVFIFISWRLITLQYCSGFCHTLIWISHGFTCVPHPDLPSRLPLHPIPLGHPSAPGLGTCLMHPTWTGDLFHTW